MTVLHQAAKRLAFKLPERVLKPVRRVRAVGVVRRFSEVDEPDLRVVESLIEPGDSVADIGANIGCYTRFLSRRVGPAGTVYAVEPVPSTFEILEHCVSRLGLLNVELRECAVSDRDRKLVMKVPPWESGGLNFYQARVVPGSITPRSTEFSVDGRSLDSLVGDVRRMAFLKVDVEGGELSCVVGARSLIARAAPAWLIEMSGDPDDPTSDSARLFEILLSKGYSAFWYDGAHIRRRRPGDRSVNYFFLSSEHLKQLASTRLLEPTPEGPAVPSVSAEADRSRCANPRSRDWGEP